MPEASEKPSLPHVINLKNASVYYKLAGYEPIFMSHCNSVEIMISAGWIGFRGNVDIVDLNVELKNNGIVPLQVEHGGSWGAPHFAHMLDEHGLGKEDRKLFIRLRDQELHIQPWYDGYLIHTVSKE